MATLHPVEELRTALWQFAATHEGRFPTDAERSAIPSGLWQVPTATGLSYLYVPGQKAGHLPELLVCEPELDPNRRFVLRTNGDILTLPSSEIAVPLSGGGTP